MYENLLIYYNKTLDTVRSNLELCCDETYENYALHGLELPLSA